MVGRLRLIYERAACGKQHSLLAGTIFEQIKDRPTTLARAPAELGRIVKTLHMLGYVDSKENRRRILTQLNRQEFRHRLARRVCHGDHGEIRKVYRQEQEEQLGALRPLRNPNSK